VDRHFKSLGIRIVLVFDLSSTGQLNRPIERTWVPADTYRMAKKREPPTPASWDVYKIAKKAVWLGTVEALDKQAAVEKAAQEFKADVWRLYAVARR
jgi:hypothetical protein